MKIWIECFFDLCIDTLPIQYYIQNIEKSVKLSVYNKKKLNT